jgi:hypothetical protein
LNAGGGEALAALGGPGALDEREGRENQQDLRHVDDEAAKRLDHRRALSLSGRRLPRQNSV